MAEAHRAGRPDRLGSAVRSRQSFAWLGEQNANLLVTPGFIPLAHTAEHVEMYRSTRESEGDGSRGRVFASMPLLIPKITAPLRNVAAGY